SGYYLDISTDNFNTIITGHQNQSVGNNISYDVTGLSSGTNYQLRVRASNFSGSSGNSNVVTVLTLTPIPTSQPTNLTFSGAAESSVIVAYTVASGTPTGYLVIRSAGSPPL